MVSIDPVPRAATLPMKINDVALSNSFLFLRSTNNPKWLRKLASMMSLSTSAITNFHETKIQLEYINAVGPYGGTICRKQFIRGLHDWPFYTCTRVHTKVWVRIDQILRLCWLIKNEKAVRPGIVFRRVPASLVAFVDLAPEEIVIPIVSILRIKMSFYLLAPRP